MTRRFYLIVFIYILWVCFFARGKFEEILSYGDGLLGSRFSILLIPILESQCFLLFFFIIFIFCTLLILWITNLHEAIKKSSVIILLFIITGIGLKFAGWDHPNNLSNNYLQGLRISVEKCINKELFQKWIVETTEGFKKSKDYVPRVYIEKGIEITPNDVEFFNLENGILKISWEGNMFDSYGLIIGAKNNDPAKLHKIVPDCEFVSWFNDNYIFHVSN